MTTSPSGSPSRPSATTTSAEAVRVTGRRLGLFRRQRELFGRRRVLALLVKRDLSVRYASSALGYFWSLLDPLLMSVIYWFVFTRIFQRGVGHEPYVIFLLVALLPWTWFQNAVGDSANALFHEARLVRSTSLPREFWVLRVVLSKGVEFLLSIPVLALLVLIFHPHLNGYIWLFPVAIIMQVVLLTGIAMILAPLTVLLRDIDPLVKVGLRFLFYVSPIIYGVHDIMEMGAPTWMKEAFLANPMTGILTAYRAGFFVEEVNWRVIGAAGISSLFILLIGQIVFMRLERQVLKEL